MKQYLIALISGLIFGFGLGLSQMIDQGRVLGFMDVAGVWDPTLLFVLGGAVGVTVITFRFVLRMSAPLFSPKFYLPTRKDIDLPLVAGAAVFGIGWGISGYCPGPAVASLALGSLNPILFVISVAVGSYIYNFVANRPAKNTPVAPKSVASGASS
ncbi:MAG: DUF6691 family protein [Caldilineaceae bacterium]